MRKKTQLKILLIKELMYVNIIDYIYFNRGVTYINRGLTYMKNILSYIGNVF